MPHRSGRIPTDLSINRLTEARERKGRIPFDLTVSNPTVCGFSYPEHLLEELCDPRGLAHQPNPQGPVATRKAVASEYDRWQTWVEPERVFLTASTSEAYSLIFRLLCDPGDMVLFPAPSYPLFDQLARLDGVTPAFYDLESDSGWRLDFSTIEDAPHTVRAIVVVHPNNPTGSYVHPDDANRLAAICRDRGWALIADEVFLPYPLDSSPGQNTTFAAIEDCLSFSLGGLSKSIGLPQLKLAWIVVNGPEALVREAVTGLEWVADAYLSVSTPTALATPELLTAGKSIHHQISVRCKRNLGALRELIRPYPAISAGLVGGGWSAIIRVPAVQNDEDLCVKLVEKHGVALLPGQFFGFPRDGYLVTSLLVRKEIFHTGIKRSLPLLCDWEHLDDATDHSPRSPDPTQGAGTGARPSLRTRIQPFLGGAAALSGLAALATGTWLARSTDQILDAWLALDRGGGPPISQSSLLVLAFALLGAGGSVLGLLSKKKMPRFEMADRLPGVDLKKTFSGVAMLALAALCLVILCYFASIESRIQLYAPLLLVTIVSALVGLERSEYRNGGRGRRGPPDWADLACGAVLAGIVIWSATRALSDWRFAWIGDEGNFFHAAMEFSRGATHSIFNLAHVYQSHPVIDSIWQAVFLRLFGENVIGWTLSEVAIAAVAAVLAFTVIRRFVRSSETSAASRSFRLEALVGGLALGCSAYTLAFVQISYNNLHTLVPPLLVMLALISLKRRPRATTLFGLGCLLGLCLYTFLATILIWFVLAVFLAPGLSSERTPTRKTSIVIFLCGFGVMVIPLALSEPSALLAGLSTSNTLALDHSAGPSRNIVSGILRSFIIFWHNQHWFDHYVAGPLLGPIEGALAATGIAVAWINRKRSAGDRFLLLWFILGVVLVAISSPNDRPRLTRLLFVMPAAAILAARGAMAIASVLRDRLHLGKRPVGAILLVAAVAMVATNVHQVYVVSPLRKPPHPNTLLLRALGEHPASRVYDVAPETEQNRRRMIEMYPWYEARYRWISTSVLSQSIDRLEDNAVFLAYDEEIAVQVHEVLPDRWWPRPYPSLEHPEFIWLFSTSQIPLSETDAQQPKATPPTPTEAPRGEDQEDLS